MKPNLSQNFSLVLLSLVLGFFFWAVAAEAEDPTMEQPYPMAVSVEVEGVPDGMVAYGADGVKARLVLRAPESVWSLLQSEDIRAFVDLSKAQPGSVTVPVQVVLQRKPVQVVDSSPEELTLILEPTAERDVPVAVMLDGSAALGFVSRTPTFVPRSVTVSGPQSLVSQVVRSLITVPLDDQRENVEGDFQPVPLDETGNPVSYVQVIPKTVTVNVPVEQLGNIRDLAVRVLLAGQPAPGYRVGSVEVEPPAVTVLGRSDVVQEIAATGYLETDPILLEDASASFTTTVALQVHEGLSVLVTPQVVVSVSIEALESKLTVQTKPQILGVRPGLTATVSPETLQLVLSGPFTAVEQLDPTQIQIEVNLSQLVEEGTYTVAPRVILPDDSIRVVSILPQSSLTVEIAPATKRVP